MTVSRGRGAPAVAATAAALSGVLVVALLLVGERGARVLPSTRRFVRAGGWRRLLDLRTAHGYVYARWMNAYIAVALRLGMPMAPRALLRRLARGYHGKVLTHDHARALVGLDHDVDRHGLEQVIPYPAARDLVLAGPVDIAAIECACRHARSSPCRPTQVCLVVGQPFVDFVLEHHPHTSRRLDRATALDLLAAEHARGHVHTAWFKDAMLDRLYVLCNCCACCCGGIEAMVRYGVPSLASSGFVARVDAAACTACGACLEACPFGALALDEVATVDQARCMGCGVCASRCGAGGIRLVRDARKGTPLDVRLLG